MTVLLPAPPIAQPISVTTDYNVATSFTPVVEGGTKVQFVDACLVDGSDCVSTLVVAGKGTFVVDASGKVTFTPVDTFAGEKLCETYRVADLWGQATFAEVCVTVSLPVGPVVSSVSKPVNYNEALPDVDVTPNVSGTKVQYDLSCLVTAFSCQDFASVAGKGTFTVDDDGVVTFTPLATFAGGSVTVTYRAYDLWGQYGENTLTVTVALPAAPVVGPDTETVDYNTVAELDPSVVGQQIQSDLACIVTASGCFRTVTIDGKGTFRVLADGSVVFTPLDTFAGGSVSVTYRAFDLWGQTDEDTLTVNVSYPADLTVGDDSETVDYGQVAFLNPVVTGEKVEPLRACLVSGSDCVRTLVVANKGTYRVLADGNVTFTPLDTFAGKSDSVTYIAYDIWNRSDASTLTVTVLLPVAPTAVGDSISVAYNQVGTLYPTVTGTKIQTGLACLVDGDECESTFVVDDKGTFVVAANGRVVFTPLDTFVGGPVSATYRAVDFWGQEVETTVSVTVLAPAKPIVSASLATVDYNQGVTLTPFVTGTKIQTALACLVDGSTCVKTLTVPGEGTFEVLSDGRVEFTPDEDFAGDVVWVTYRAEDLWGQTGENTVAVTVSLPAAPIVAPARETIDYNTSALLEPVVTGTYVQPIDACLMDGSDCVKELEVTGKGTFTVLDNGKVTFVPFSTFAGGIAWATYRATDRWGQHGFNTVSVDVALVAAPNVDNLLDTTDYDTPIDITPIVDSVRINDARDCLVSLAGCLKTQVVPGKGTFEVDENGRVTFTPSDTFVGTVCTTYRVYDMWGQYGQSRICVTVLPPAGPEVDEVVRTIEYNTPTEMTPNVSGFKPVPNKSCFVSGLRCVKTFTIRGAGTFTVADTGVVTFSPLSTFADGTVVVTYRAYDMWGQFGENTVTVTVALPDAPTVDPETQTIAWDEVATFIPVVDGANIQNNLACIVSGDSCVRSLTVPNVGTYLVLADGSVEFTPVLAFIGGTHTVTYRAVDQWGQTGKNDLTVKVSEVPDPTVEPVIETIDYNTVADILPVVDGTNIVDSQACLVSGSDCVKTLVVTGKGTFLVLDDGSVTFTPLDTFAGSSVTVTYRAKDFLGQTGENTIVVDVLKPEAPSVDDDSATVAYNTAATLSPTATGTKVQTSTACLVSGSDCVKTLVVPGEGTFVVQNNGTVVFTPLNTFAGNASEVTYCISDLFAQQVCATLFVEVSEPADLVVTPRTVNTAYQTQTAFNPVVTGEGINYATACLVDPADSDCKTTVSITGVGTWTVNTSNGRVTFTPANGYAGSAVIEYRVSNFLGRESTGDMTVVVSGSATLTGAAFLDLNKNGLQDANEPGLSGILVTAGSTAPAGFGAAATSSYSVRTDAQGRYSFDVVPGTYQVKAFLSSNVLYTSSAKDPDTKIVETTSSWVAVTAAAGDSTTVTNFAAAGNGAIAGTAVYTSGISVPRATVSCVWSGFDGVLGTSDDVLITTKADAKGSFALTGIPGGKFECGGKDPKTGVSATKTGVKVKGTSNPNTKPVKTPVVLPIKVGGKFTFIVSNFVPGSAKVTSQIKERITYFVKKYKQATKVSVEGFTQGPTVLKVDYKLSLDRARNALAIIKSVNDKLKVIHIKNTQLNEVGSNIRRVRVTLYW